MTPEGRFYAGKEGGEDRAGAMSSEHGGRGGQRLTGRRVGASRSEAGGGQARGQMLETKVAEPRLQLWEGEAEGDGRGGPGVEASG